MPERCSVHRVGSGLLRAVLAITADISSPAVLDHLLTTACDLLHARHAALAVFAAGDLSRFLQAGAGHADAEAVEDCRLVDESVVQQLAEADQPLRIDDLSAHPVPVGWAPGPGPLHFPRRAICARGQTVGALCLGDKAGLRAVPEPFSDEDEELAQALARAAGLAFDNARLFQQTQREQAWQRASAEITAALLSGIDTERRLPRSLNTPGRSPRPTSPPSPCPRARRSVIRLADGHDAPGVRPDGTCPRRDPCAATY